ncbi:uncharacterized protein N7498_001637 [Penicillium cinerascens]|uniref:Uncharacterized protein n=1 Tax=Penicillium cinerascens TaxID=70096 RepID=A0A9W9N8I5_9EURO|nr:uncharacterized protein N7498_001637 [Penicillium cinerascens]KAJ5215230.1 hypothetical protein N7498_001637 [Penicillium cinerascens]
MKLALEYRRDKLTEYYGKTDDIPNDLYAIGTILGPRNKLEFFLTPEWETHWAPRYKQSLETYVQPYQQRHIEAQSISTIQSMSNDISDIDILLRPTTSLQSRPTTSDKLTRYLGSKTKEYDPISDDEEDPIIDASVEVSIERPSLRALGKRRAVDDPLTEPDDDEIPLPDFDI